MPGPDLPRLNRSFAEQAAGFHHDNPSPVVIVTLSGESDYLNPAAMRLLTKIRARRDEIERILPPDYISIQQNCLASDIDIPLTEMDLGRRIYEWRAFSLRDGDHVQYTARDVTRTRQHEQRLIRAREAAEAGQTAKQAFLDNMTHEIRTPLNSLLGFMQILSDELWDDLNEDQRMQFSLVQQNGERLARTMREILDASMIASGIMKTTIQRVDLCKTLDESMESLIESAVVKDLSFQFEPPGEDITVSADPYCLNQMIGHLVENAIKYTSEGSVRVSVSTDNENATIHIEDTGPGMSDEYMSRIFTPFNQDTYGHSKHFQGIGLGLTLVRGYADLIGARVDVESEQGAGTRFTLQIPIT